jgi:hypothetical protein
MSHSSANTSLRELPRQRVQGTANEGVCDYSLHERNQITRLGGKPPPPPLAITLAICIARPFDHPRSDTFRRQQAAPRALRVG